LYHEKYQSALMLYAGMFCGVSSSPIAAGDHIRIFISYRREDVAGYAGRLRDRLVGTYGSNSVFMDVHSLRSGQNYVEIIQNAVKSCDVLIAMIGGNWLGKGSSEPGGRLSEPGDLVQIEIATALKRSIPVIPVLVDGAGMPDALPSALSGLSRRHALSLDNETFHTDVDRLIEHLGKPRRRKFFQVLLLVLLLGAVGITAWNFGLRTKSFDTSPWEGVWEYSFQGKVGGQTQLIEGELVLFSSRDGMVEGNYTNEGGRMGIVEGRMQLGDQRIEGIWRSGIEEGKFYFILSPDQQSFSGGYSTDISISPEENPHNFWRGIRKPRYEDPGEKQ
jgi:hypothetical protein